MDTALRSAIGAAVGADVTAAGRLSGGDVAESYRVELADGRVVFAKTKAGAPAGFFTTEAASLSWLRAAGGVAVPDVLAADDGTAMSPNLLVLEWIEEGGRPTDATESTFGSELATLHRAGAPCFGREDLRTSGSRGLPNRPHDAWAEFYATQRLLPLVRIARDERALPDRVLDDLEAVAGRLDVVGGDPEPPARLHGDLWAGNRLIDRDGRNWLIDPSAYGGHREFDLAMMRLFGGFGPAAFAAYDDAFPLSAGADERIALHQIAPLVVHAVKFGGGYREAAERAIATYR
ncbi:MAG: fructosamine kinase family protein [Acidimicrobiales bacterium]